MTSEHSLLELINNSSLYIESFDELKEQMFSFASAMATAIDERTPYNGSHTRKVYFYAGLVADHINMLSDHWEIEDYFDDERKDQLLLAAALHDIGKMIVPLRIMDKSTRLEQKINPIYERIKLFHAYNKIDMLSDRITEDEFYELENILDDIYEVIVRINETGLLDDDDFNKIQSIGNIEYKLEDGSVLRLLTDEEVDCLSIRKGTLTEDERAKMQRHVVYTKRILSKVHFGEKFKDVPVFAAQHHELLDGSGYPEHLKGDEIPLESRILTVVDIFDALTSEDRPYKEPVSRKAAFKILHSMADDGKLEERIVGYLEDALSEISEQEVIEKTLR